MEFRILGPLEVADGDSLIALPQAQRALLALLVLSANEVVSTDRLIEALWGERSPESGRTALQVRVSQLRKGLGEGGALVVTRPPGYVLRVDAEQVDLERFERLVAEAEQADPSAAAGGIPPILRSPDGLRRKCRVRMDRDAEDEACLSGVIPAGGAGVGPSGPLDPGRRRVAGGVAADAAELAPAGRARQREERR